MKHQGEIPLNYQYTLRKTKDRKVKLGLSGGGYQLKGYKERAKVGNVVDVFCMYV
jgi:hypothetical protein